MKKNRNGNTVAPFCPSIRWNISNLRLKIKSSKEASFLWSISQTAFQPSWLTPTYHTVKQPMKIVQISWKWYLSFWKPIVKIHKMKKWKMHMKSKTLSFWVISTIICNMKPNIFIKMTFQIYGLKKLLEIKMKPILMRMDIHGTAKLTPW